MDWLTIFLFILGLSFAVFGSLLLFKKGFVEKMREEIWKEKRDIWPEKEGYRYDKYGRGLGLLIVGLLLIAYVIFSLFF